jgi:hypothetical protein
MMNLILKQCFCLFFFSSSTNRFTNKVSKRH